MASNQFVPFAIGSGANVLAPAALAARANVPGGFTAGIAPSDECNTLWRQSSFGVAALAQLMADVTGQNVNDDGTVANFEKLLLLALGQALYAVDTGGANAYEANYAPALLGVYDGLRLRFRAAHANTGASTFSANGLPDHPIVNASHAALPSGSIVANGEVELVYNAAIASWVLVTSTGPGASTGAGEGAGGDTTVIINTAFPTTVLTAPGYAIFGNGLIAQFGRKNGGGHAVNQPFPLAFPTTCAAVLASNSIGPGANMTTTYTTTNTGFNVWQTDESGNPSTIYNFNWIAIGW
jgi:hypothetical protein